MDDTEPIFQPVPADSPKEPLDLRHLGGMTLGALGIVYGDIGTSPLYALRECFHGDHAVPPTHDNVLGVLSLIFWSLILVVSVKYLIFIMRADNRGEGGILALVSLLRPREGRVRWALLAMGLFGAALLYGDGMITPSISVLSAVEGLNEAAPVFGDYIVPITISILIGMFLIQRHGTAGIGRFFGPVMVLWFAVLGVLGVSWIVREPSVLTSANPYHAVNFFIHNGGIGFLVLGSVFLVVTGGEALYADMGHFGRRPIRFAWFSFVLPSLLLNYFGQGAMLLQVPAAAEQPFYRLVPAWGLYPLVILATCAAVIASQAVISGAFSLTRQAVQLGYCPRVQIVHTSEEEIGQIYIPSVNWFLMLSTIGLVLGFQNADNLAAAYGIAITTTMVTTTLLAYFVAREVWHWKRPAALAVMGLFLAFDLSFFAANLPKIPQGGWFPLVVAAVVFLLMSTWKQGRRLVAERLRAGALPLHEFIRNLQPEDPPRVPGTAIFLTAEPHGTPTTLLHNLKHNKVLHQKVVLLTVMTEEVPIVPPEERLTMEKLDKGFYRLTARYGFIQDPRAADVLKHARAQGLELDVMKTTFFLGRETLLPDEKQKGMALWRRRLFAVMAKNSERFNEFFRIPPNRVVELGMQVKL